MTKGNKINARRYPLATLPADRATCGVCGHTLPKRGQWKRACASCQKRAQGREVAGPQRHAGWRPTVRRVEVAQP